MKICVTSKGPDLESAMDPRFGFCPYFIFVDPETLSFEAVKNPHLEENGESGIKSALFLNHEAIEAVITGPVGPHIYETLRDAGIKIYIGPGGNVQEVVKRYKQKYRQG